MSIVPFLLFFALVVAIVGLINAHALRWAAVVFSLSDRSRRVLAVVLYGSLGVTFLTRVADWLWTDAPVRVPLMVASLIQLAVVVSVVLLFVVDAVLFVRARLGRLFAARRAEPEPSRAVAAPADADAPRAGVTPAREPASGFEAPRRAFLVQAAASSAFTIGCSSSLYGVFAGRHDYSIEDVPVSLPGLSRSLDGYTIVQLSDIHIGQFVGEAELAAAEELVARARPDLIVMTGDLIDHDVRRAGELGRFAQRLKPLARDGVVAITGNHDFYAGVEPTVAALERGGATVLRNRGIVIGERDAGFALLGVDDVWAARRSRGGGPDLERAVESLPELSGSALAARSMPRVLLCHNPTYFEHAAGKVGLQLSGHTHGGQVNLVVRPADLVLKNGWVAGRYTRDGSQLYINRGFGTVGPPARIGAPPEITRVVLTV